MKTKIEDLKSVIREFGSLSQELLSENHWLNTELEKSKDSIAERKNELNHLREDHAREVQQLHQNIQDLKDDKDKLEKEKSALETKYSDLSSTKEKVKKKKEELIQENKKLIQEKEELIKENEELRDRVSNLEERLTMSSDTIEVILSQLLEQMKDDNSAVHVFVKKVDALLDTYDFGEPDDSKDPEDTEETEDPEDTEDPKDPEEIEIEWDDEGKQGLSDTNEIM